jgi:hypothetical protein
MEQLSWDDYAAKKANIDSRKRDLKNHYDTQIKPFLGKINTLERKKKVETKQLIREYDKRKNELTIETEQLELRKPKPFDPSE